MATNETDLYYLWLGAACDFEPKLIDMCFNSMMKHEGDTLSETYNSAEYMISLYENRKEIQSQIDKSSYKNRINLNASLDEAVKIAEECKKLGIKIITLSNKDYPNRLRNIYCPPKFIFVKGDITGLDDVLGISIVGTRSATKAGIANTEKIAYDLASRGVIITSGMALGIDSAAHAGAIGAGGRTFAVLAGGVDVVYPAVNRDLYEMICETGAVISERPPHCIGRPEFYQQRNRIITGLSLGVLIAEGREKSGTSITARLAFENNRDIFAMPNDIKLVQSQLPNSLIKEGATLIRGASDILAQYKYIYPNLNSEVAETIENSKAGNKIIDIFKRIIGNSTENTAKKSRKVKGKLNKSVDEVNSETNIAKTKDETKSADNIGDTDINARTEMFFKRKEFTELSEEDKMIFRYIGDNMESGITVDELAEHFGLAVSVLNTKLLAWQIKGLIVQSGGLKLYLKL